MKTNFKIVLNFLVTLSIPLILSTLSILVLLSPVFTTLEYRRPGFPEDSARDFRRTVMVSAQRSAWILGIKRAVI